MNFTREPIIETVITPREGCKLVVRSSKGNGQEDYFVDAIEVVSFGHSFFFRSQERPKSFLVPMSDYEILETKETRMVLKNVSSDRSIKIGGGREVPPPRRESESREEDLLSESRPAPERQERQQGGQLDRKRDKRRRGRRGRDRNDYPQETRSDAPEIKERADEEIDHSAEVHEFERNEGSELPHSENTEMQNRSNQRPHQTRGRHARDRSTPSEDLLSSGGEVAAREPAEKAPSFISKLFPPPTTLIKESLSRYKPVETAGESAPIQEEPKAFEETIFDHPIDKQVEDENEE